MEAAGTGLGRYRVHPIRQFGSRYGVVPAYVVERRIAEGAFGPVTSVGEHHLVPPSVAPEAVHRVGHLAEREVFRQGQSAEVGTSPFPVAYPFRPCMISLRRDGSGGFLFFQNAGECRLTVVEYDIVHIGEDRAVAHQPQFRRGVSAAHDDPYIRITEFYLLPAAQGGEQVARKGDGESDEIGAVLCYGSEQEFRHPLLDDVHGAEEFRFKGGEFGKRQRQRQVFGIPDYFESRCDGSPDEIADVLQIERADIFRAILYSHPAELLSRRRHGFKTPRLRQKVAPADSGGERRLLPPEKGHDALYRSGILAAQCIDTFEISVGRIAERLLSPG